MYREPLNLVPGITRTQATLLEASGVRSPEDLARNNPDKLLRWMTEVNAEKRLVRRLPELQQVRQWVEGAQNLQPA